MSDRVSNKGGLKTLRGAEVRVFDLTFEVFYVVRGVRGASGSSSIISAPVANRRSGREALRGSEVETIDLVFEFLTSEQCAELLKGLLEHAADTGYRDLAQQRLVRAGAEIGDALHEALRRSGLLEGGALIDAKDTNGYTPLHVAACKGNTEMVQLFLLKGTDDNNDRTPLPGSPPLATWLPHWLLAAGADANLRCGGRINAAVMHVTAQQGNVEIVRAMIVHGADLEAVASDQHTALHQGARTNKAEAIDVLVEAGAHIKARDRHGCAPLHFAAHVLSRKALLRFLKHGATVRHCPGQLPQHTVDCCSNYSGILGVAAAEVADSLLRAGDEGRLVEDFERVRELLAKAPADGVWRRRGYVVLCRAHSERLQQAQVISGTYHTDTGRITRNSAKLATAEGVAGDGKLDETDGGDWAVVMAKRTIQDVPEFENVGGSSRLGPPGLDAGAERAAVSGLVCVPAVSPRAERHQQPAIRRFSWHCLQHQVWVCFRVSQQGLCPPAIYQQQWCRRLSAVRLPTGADVDCRI